VTDDDDDDDDDETDNHDKVVCIASPFLRTVTLARK
jgi:hypothetical protein